MKFRRWAIDHNARAFAFRARPRLNAGMTVPAFVMVSMRPRGGHAGLRRAAARHGGRVLALSPWRLESDAGDAARQALRDTLQAPVVVFSSPAAVRAAYALRRLAARRDQTLVAVGEGTRRALVAAGVDTAIAPTRMDSEGVLALPALAGLGRGDRVGLVSAPGGRGEIARLLAERGVDIVRADVYRRVPLALSRVQLGRLQAALAGHAPVYLALSSGAAFEQVWAQMSDVLKQTVRNARVVAASARLAHHARSHGFMDVVVAASARPGDLLAAIER